MRYAIAVLIALLLVGPLLKGVKRWPVAFYAAALAVVAVYLYEALSGARGVAWAALSPLMQRCTLAFVLFSLVMFIGVLKDGSALRSRLVPVRRQLSILACIFAFGHIGYYLASYLPHLFGVSKANVVLSLGLALFLTVLLVVLLVTSFMPVKARMAAAAWKRVQKLAYPFYILICVHAVCFLLPSAFSGSLTAIEGAAVYTVAAGAYLVLRLYRAFQGRFSTRREEQQLQFS